MRLAQTKHSIKSFIEKKIVGNLMASKQGFKLKHFEKWHPALDEALKALPETEVCTHELFRQLMRNPSSVPKKMILVTEKGEPVALAGLRLRGSQWEPITNWILPGVLFPIKEGYVGRILPSLGVNLKIGWWRLDSSPPLTKWTKEIKSAPKYGISCAADFEDYWKRSGQFKTIRKARNRCKQFKLKIDGNGLTDWTIKKWEKKWRPEGAGENIDLDDRILVARYLKDHGLYHTLSLMDQGEPTASSTQIVHGKEIVAQYIYRNPKYNWHGVGTRLIEQVFFWSKEVGFEGIDIGGAADYKMLWAPQNGERWEFSICPDYFFYIERFCEIVRRTIGKL